jgi:RND family efflux transporter MFP subunit
MGSSNSNSVLFEVAKTDILRVYVYVPEQYVPYIHENEEALLSFQAYPNKQFTGIVSNVAGGLDPTSKTLQVEIHVQNSDHQLLPGMYAQVQFQMPTLVRVPVVPATTLQVRPDGGFMYVVDDQNRVHMKKAVVGRDLGAHFEINSGIAVGDKVIVNPSDEMRDGIFVRPVLAPMTKTSKGF